MREVTFVKGLKKPHIEKERKVQHLEHIFKVMGEENGMRRNEKAPQERKGKGKKAYQRLRKDGR